MVSIDYTLIIQIINFVVLIWALNLVLYRPIRGIINQRTEKVEGLETGIERFEQDVVDKDQAIKDGLKEARAKGVEEKVTLENEARALEKKRSRRSMKEPARIWPKSGNRLPETWNRPGSPWRLRWINLLMISARKFWGGRFNDIERGIAPITTTAYYFAAMPAAYSANRGPRCKRR